MTDFTADKTYAGLNRIPTWEDSIKFEDFLTDVELWNDSNSSEHISARNRIAQLIRFAFVKK